MIDKTSDSIEGWTGGSVDEVNNYSLGKDIEKRTEKLHRSLPFKLFKKTTEKKNHRC